MDFESSFEDWIEIRNYGSTSVNLAGYHLSDKIGNPSKWTFPSVNVSPGAVVIVFASGKNLVNPEFHSNFSLSQGELLYLTDPALNLLDSMTLPYCPAPYSYGRNTNNVLSFFSSPTFNDPNNGMGYWGVTVAPAIQPSTGVYSSDQLLSFLHHDPNVTIHYTIDGSEPDVNDPVLTAGTMLSFIGTNAGNYWSLIPTNPSFNYPLGSYDSARANTRGWLPPYSNVYRFNVVKAKAFPNYPGALPSESTTSAVMVDPQLNSNFSLPIFSLIADSSDLFSDDRGIYVWGNAIDGNYNEVGDNWERKANIALIDVNGITQFESVVGIRTHGGGGRHSCQKSLKLNFREEYGKGHLDYILFPGKTQNRFDNLILRSNGHRPDCIPRDDISSLIVEGIPLDHMNVRQVVVFINGEYWGLHSIKENLNADYFANKYSIPKEEVTTLDKEGDVEEGTLSDSLLFQNLKDFIDGSDMTISSNYDWVKTQMDVDNFIDYQLSEIYFGNGDWPNSNTRMWRKSTSFNPLAPAGQDGRFRWIFYDQDGSFGGSCSNVFPSMNGIQQATLTGPLFGSYTKILRGLLTNNDFKTAFINRYCDLLNSWFKENRIQSIVQQSDNIYRPEMQRHVERWRYPSMSTSLADRANEVPDLQRWDAIIYQLDSFARYRPEKQRNQFQAYFSLGDSIKITLNVNDTVMGRVKINSLLIHPQLPGVEGPTYPWTGLYYENIPLQLKAIPMPGYQFLEWQGTGITTDEITVTLNTDSVITALFVIDPSYDPLRDLKFNEVMAKNNSFIADNYGEYDDWFEIYNPGSDTIDLNNYFVSTSLIQPTQFQIIAGDSSTKIPPYGFKLFWADNDLAQGNLHCNFTLPAAAGSLYLFLPDGITMVDSIHYEGMTDNVSYGCYPDGSDDKIWFYYATPGMSNLMTSMAEETAIAEQLIPYPNPADGEELFLNRSTTFSVYDVNGKLILNRQNTNRIPLQDMVPGLYFIIDKQGNHARFIRL